MGISVSASAAIIAAGLFIAFGAMYPVAENGFDRVTSAQETSHDRALERENVDVTFVNATDDGTTLNVTVENTGAESIPVPRTTLVADNEYVSVDPSETTVYDADADPSTGDTETELWLPGERLRFSVPSDGENAVLVATESGIQVRGTVVAA
ncbi:flagellin [Halopenitus sp. POP-27]|uniref:flagellin n=1 Tax=Halopenitus sp. POP-27 TaxID=2994425 RepID=UPI00246903AA|nr:flagellin [Halopenitus sp. POP-27]